MGIVNKPCPWPYACRAYACSAPWVGSLTGLNPVVIRMKLS